MSGRTYEKAKTVVKAAEIKLRAERKAGETFAHILERINRLRLVPVSQTSSSQSTRICGAFDTRMGS